MLRNGNQTVRMEKKVNRAAIGYGYALLKEVRPSYRGFGSQRLLNMVLSRVGHKLQDAYSQL